MTDKKPDLRLLGTIVHQIPQKRFVPIKDTLYCHWGCTLKDLSSEWGAMQEGNRQRGRAEFASKRQRTMRPIPSALPGYVPICHLMMIVDGVWCMRE